MDSTRQYSAENSNVQDEKTDSNLTTTTSPAAGTFGGAQSKSPSRTDWVKKTMEMLDKHDFEGFKAAWEALKVISKKVDKHIPAAQMEELHEVGRILCSVMELRSKLVTIGDVEAVEGDEYRKLEHRCNAIPHETVSQGIAVFIGAKDVLKNLSGKIDDVNRIKMAEAPAETANEMVEVEGVVKPAWFWQAMELLNSQDFADIKNRCEETTAHSAKVSEKIAKMGPRGAGSGSMFDPGAPLAAMIRLRETIAKRVELRKELTKLSKVDLPTGEEYNQLQHSCKTLIARFNAAPMRLTLDQSSKAMKDLETQVDIVSGIAELVFRY